VPHPNLTIEQLLRILRESAGESDAVPGRDVLDTEFADLGYDSLALLEATGRIGREYGLRLDDDVVVAAVTPRQLLAVVNDTAGR
jgi:act minimal PKS acyl carrier protein